jgi:tetraacyldisaccharide 4'-kinase
MKAGSLESQKAREPESRNSRNLAFWLSGFPAFRFYLEDVVTGVQSGVASQIVRAGLLPISLLVLAGVKLRRWLYSKGILRVKRLPCKVISVGNVVVGGSGKTPAVIAITTMLRNYKNLRIGILSRGYLSKVKGPAVVSDGENLLLDTIEAGDEPHLISRNLHGVPVFIGKDRFETGLIASNKYHCQVVILDDGFQYLRLARDMDIITIDATQPFGYEHILPRGYLREPVSTLKCADLIILTRTDQCENLDSVREKLSRMATSVPVFESIHKPGYLYTLEKYEKVGLDTINGKKILAVCGIANPRSFLKTLQSLNPAEMNTISFPDHYSYPADSIKNIKQVAERLKADMIITTEKDAPKLIAISEYPVLFLKIELELVNSSAEKLVELILKRCGLV